jgi:creatinine deaminase
MLVLTRQRDQSVMIGDETEVTVIDIRGDKVRLGISAPRSVVVHRKEIYLEIKRENEEAAKLQPADLGDIPQPQGATFPRPVPAADPFMAAALEEARLGLQEGGLPIGSVLVRDGRIIGRGHNRRVQKSDPMAHAEIDCLTQAGRLATYKDTILYSTLMPCYLCSGAVVQFRIPRVIVGDTVNFKGGPELLRRHGVTVTDLADPDCIHLMAQFIKDHPDLWNEDIGVDKPR